MYGPESNGLVERCASMSLVEKSWCNNRVRRDPQARGMDSRLDALVEAVVGRLGKATDGGVAIPGARAMVDSMALALQVCGGERHPPPPLPCKHPLQCQRHVRTGVPAAAVRQCVGRRGVLRVSPG
jgi:hypothetical protein